MPAPRLGSSPARAVTLTMRPAVPDASIERIAARLHRKVVRALVSRAGVESATVLNGSPFAGLRFSRYFPFDGATQPPPMKFS